MASTSTTPIESDSTMSRDNSPTPAVGEGTVVNKAHTALLKAVMDSDCVVADARKAIEDYKRPHLDEEEAKASQKVMEEKLKALKEAVCLAIAERNNVRNLLRGPFKAVEEAVDLVYAVTDASKRLPALKDQDAAVLEEGEFVVELNDGSLFLTKTPPIGFNCYNHEKKKSFQRVSRESSVSQMALEGKFSHFSKESNSGEWEYLTLMKTVNKLDYDNSPDSFKLSWKKIVDTIVKNMDEKQSAELVEFMNAQTENFAPTNEDSKLTAALSCTNKESKRPVVMAIKGQLDQPRLDNLVNECIFYAGGQSVKDVWLAQIGKGLGDLKLVKTGKSPNEKKSPRTFRKKHLPNQIHGRKCPFSQNASKEEKNHLRAL